MKMEQDYKQEMIDELKKLEMVDDQATKAFVECFSAGDSFEAIRKFQKMADRVEFWEPNTYMLAIFEDGSCYADWKEGLDSFYPSIHDLIDEDPDVRERLGVK